MGHNGWLSLKKSAKSEKVRKLPSPFLRGQPLNRLWESNVVFLPFFAIISLNWWENYKLRITNYNPSDRTKEENRSRTYSWDPNSKGKETTLANSGSRVGLSQLFFNHKTQNNFLFGRHYERGLYRLRNGAYPCLVRPIFILHRDFKISHIDFKPHPASRQTYVGPAV